MSFFGDEQFRRAEAGLHQQQQQQQQQPEIWTR
jgi:hypothetical protein